MKANVLIAAALLLAGILAADLQRETCLAETLSSGVFFRFEAEYASSAMVNPGDEHKANCFYKSDGKDGEARIGRHFFSPFYSNCYFWSVEEGASGWAFGGLRSRWRDAAGGYPRLGSAFRFWNGVVPVAGSAEANQLEVTYAFSCGNLDACEPDTPLARFRLDSHVKDGSVLGVRHRAGNNELKEETILTKADYLALPVIFDKGTEKRLLTLSVPFASFHGPDPGRETDDAVTVKGMYLELVNLDPLMYWYGNGSLMLDYIEFHDDIHDNCTLHSRNRVTRFSDNINIDREY